MGRWLGKVLGALKILKLQFLAFFQFREDLVLLLFLVRLDIDRHKSVKFQSGRCHCELVSAGSDLYGRSLIDCGGHTARREAFPDQLIKPELISR